MEYILQASAKVNLFLDITGDLPGGFHAVDTLMQSVDLYDTLFLRPAPDIRIDCPGVAQEQNTAFRAARLFFTKSGLAGGIHARIQKGIPFASGMGGSSADAAGLLFALNELFSRPFSPEALSHLGAEIGSDVSFLLRGGCMRCRGRGEELSPVPNAFSPAYLAVRADGFVTAGQAYAAYDRVGGAHGDVDAVLAALAQGDGEAFLAHTANALADACAALCPAIPATLSRLREDPACLGAFMTGSGSVCIGVYPDKDAAEAARPRFAGGFCAVLQNTPRSLVWAIPPEM